MGGCYNDDDFHIVACTIRVIDILDNYLFFIFYHLFS